MLSAIKSFTTRRVVYKRAFADGQDDRNFKYTVLKRKSGFAFDTHHHMDPLPRFLFLVVSANDTYAVTESTASNIQGLIFQGVSRVSRSLRVYPTRKKILRSSLSHRDRQQAPCTNCIHWTNISRDSRTFVETCEPHSRNRCAHDPDANRPIRSSLTPRSFRGVAITIAAIHHVTPLESNVRRTVSKLIGVIARGYAPSFSQQTLLCTDLKILFVRSASRRIESQSCWSCQRVD